LVVLVGCGGSGPHGAADASIDGSDAGVDGDDASIDSIDASTDGAVDVLTEAGDVPREVPTVLVPARDPASCTSMDLAIVGATLFWSDEARGEVRRMSVTGGDSVTIATGENHPQALVARGGAAFWLAGPQVDFFLGASLRPNQSRAAMVRSAPIAGGAAATIVAPADGVTGFTASPDGQTVYFGVSTMVQKISAAGANASPVEVAYDELGIPVAFALDGSVHSFVTDITGAAKAVQLVAGDVATCVKTNDGTAPGHHCVRLGAATDTHTLVAQDGRLYWGTTGAIISAPIETTTPGTSQTFVEVDGTVQALAATGRTMVFTTFDSSATTDGLIGEASLDGSSLITLADGENRPASIVTDGVRAYWSTADCAIRSIALR
jgi:hypothetical protein